MNRFAHLDRSILVQINLLASLASSFDFDIGEGVNSFRMLQIVLVGKIAGRLCESLMFSLGFGVFCKSQLPGV